MKHEKYKYNFGLTLLRELERTDWWSSILEKKNLFKDLLTNDFNTLTIVKVDWSIIKNIFC